MANEQESLTGPILKGHIEKILTADRRGTRYRIEGPAQDNRTLHVLCRFKEDTHLIVITVYALLEDL